MEAPVERRTFLQSAALGATVLALPRAAHAEGAEFDGPIHWQPWEAGLKEAGARKKAICLVLYADWCPHCRELAPAWKDAEVVKLAKGLVMIHQNVDERPEWMTRKYGHLGHYVPRILFLKPDGVVQEDITSGNQRFPYFYQPQHLDALRASMTRALGSKSAKG
jgi:thiol:disulfide interchange protein